MQYRIWAAVAAVLAGGVASAAEPTITTYAGGGNSLVDGIAATQALVVPEDIAVDKAGNLFISGGCRIQKVDTAGKIRTIAGNGGSNLPYATNVPATSTTVCGVGIALGPDGNLYVAAYTTIRRINLSTGIITTIAGSPDYTQFRGDGGPAVDARLDETKHLAFDSAGNLFAQSGLRIRRIDKATGIMTTIAGDGLPDGDGDGGQAKNASVYPTDITFDRNGNLLMVDDSTNWPSSIRRIGTNGVIQRIAGLPRHFRLDPLATRTDQHQPTGIAVDARNNIYVSHRVNYISMISPAGIGQPIAGEFNDTILDPYGAQWGFGGDGGPASKAMFNVVMALAFDPQGNLYAADRENFRVRKITGTFPVPRTPYGVGQFIAPTTYLKPGYSPVEAAAVADMDANGLSDVVIFTGHWATEDASNDRIYIYRQGADRKLTTPTTWKIEGMGTPRGLAVGRLNNDAYPEVVVASDAGLQVYYMSPAQVPTAKATLPLFADHPKPGDIALEDLDADGDLDILTLSYQTISGPNPTAGLVLFYNNGSGQFPRKRYVPIPYSFPLTLEDMNHDGRRDLVAASSYGIDVFAHDGVDSFRAPFHIEGENSRRYMAFGDFDSDGLKDVVMADSGGNSPDSAIYFYEETASGAWAYSGKRLMYDGADSVLVDDMNGDGRDDVVVQHWGWTAISYLQQARLQDGRWGLDTTLKTRAQVRNMAIRGSMTLAYMDERPCKDVVLVDSAFGIQIISGNVCLKVKYGPDSPPKPKVKKTATALPPSVAAASVSATTSTSTMPGWQFFEGLRTRWGRVDASPREATLMITAIAAPSSLVTAWWSFESWWTRLLR